VKKSGVYGGDVDTVDGVGLAGAAGDGQQNRCYEEG
jgi:hypothetical protein